MEGEILKEKMTIIGIVVCVMGIFMCGVALLMYNDVSKHNDAPTRFTYVRVQGPSFNDNAFVATDKDTGKSYLFIEHYGAVGLEAVTEKK